MAWTKALLAAGVLAVGAAATAQTPAIASQAQTEPDACDATSSTARQFKFDGEASFAAASIRWAMTYDCTSILLYRLMPRHPPKPIRSKEDRLHPPPDNRPHTGAPVFYARIHSKHALSDTPDRPMWADQKTCPALLPVIEALQIALTPTLTGEGPVRDDRLYSTVDGASVVVWAAGIVYPLNNESHHFDSTYRTNLGTPTADWVEKTLKDLKPCLSPTQPTPDPPIP
ncbi:MAG TPA: hypothetical protein VGO52_00740 [Hyphomonadaceae bacterium]|jgi:hypothetical protein|nr:hypothetical protein [Hyphomonadaceae bacterium]